MTKLWIWVFISVGAILILLSIIGHVYQWHPLVTTGLETIGVTLASVFSIKLIYEKLIAQEHFGQFHNLLKTEFANFQNLTWGAVELRHCRNIPRSKCST